GITLGSSAGVLLVFLVLGILVVFVITRPLREIGKHMNAVSRMSFDNIPLTNSFIHEVKAIQWSFFSMVFALKSFRKYVPEAVIRKTMATRSIAQMDLLLKECTLFFLDIVDFTTISEKLRPDELMVLMSEAMEKLSDIVAEESGFIDKYIGDAIMALWGVPEEVEDHQYRACIAALRCVQVLKDNADNWTNRGFPALRCRVGIHFGEALVGNFGSSNRLNYTALGDPVNLAARLEPLCKHYGTDTLVSSDMYELIKGRIICRAVDVVMVKGRTQETILYELLSKDEEATVNHTKIEQASNNLVLAMRSGEVRNIRRCINNAQKVPGYSEDKALSLLLERFAHHNDDDIIDAANRFREKHF
ncbi:adenylate cyclase, partial [Acrasis kona]